MFADFLFEKSSAAFSDRVLLFDSDEIESKTKYSEYFQEQGFFVIHYKDDLHMRLENDDAIDGAGKYLLIVRQNQYVPYDILRLFQCFEISVAALFPKLNTSVIKESININYDLLAIAYSENYADLRSQQDTKRFLSECVYGKKNVEKYLNIKTKELHDFALKAVGYKNWFNCANIKSSIDTLAAEYEIDISTEDINDSFIEYVLENYGKLSSDIDQSSPVLVSRAMEYMSANSEKFAVIVMDGMSKFDWKILSNSFRDVIYEESSVFAMIPTTTSISRQCLLSNKYPSQLLEPWKQSKEKAEFIDCSLQLGFTQEQIGYERGYNADFGSFIKCAAVIINDIDDLVHSQMQGRTGMYNDVNYLAKKGLLLNLVKRLLEKGFDVYITADHGNTPCSGMGKLMKTGVEVETKSRRMFVLKDFADKNQLRNQYSLIEYPKYYLNKDYDYLICNYGKSFDAKGSEVMSHGGITVDEVIVPFVKIKAVNNNG